MIPWNKGLTKETDRRVARVSRIANKRRNLCKVEGAYWAGFIDGDGCITISMNRSGTGSHKTPYYIPRVHIANTNREVLMQLKETVNCGTVTLQQHSTDRAKEVFVYRAIWRDAEYLLRQVLPFLRVKKKQAALLLQFIEKKRNRRNGTGGLLTEDELRKREQFYQEIRHLNRKGPLEKGAFRKG